MKYTLNPAYMTSMFAMPTEIVEKHLKIASGIQLKVLLYMQKNGFGEQSLESIEQAVGVSKNDALEALDFWVQRKVLMDTEKQLANETKEIKPKSVHMAAKPTRSETAKRISESQELKIMFAEVQSRLGRLITQAEMSTLVWIHDNQGLPASVILMSIEYAKSEEKLSFSYIEKMCIDWAQNDIDTVEKAEERINLLFLSRTSWKIVENAFGISHRKPSVNEKKYSYRWINEYGFTKDILTIAYNMCIDGISKMNFSYINKILEKWYKAGVKTVADIENVENAGKSASKTTSNASYDLNKIKAKFNNFDEE